MLLTIAAATLVYGGGLVAVCTASMDSAGPHGFYFQGEKGAIRVHGLPNFFTKVELLLPDREPQVFELNRYEHRLCHQLEDYRDIFESGDRAAAFPGTVGDGKGPASDTAGAGAAVGLPRDSGAGPP